jgi:hypothetical protein
MNRSCGHNTRLALAAAVLIASAITPASAQETVPSPGPAVAETSAATVPVPKRKPAVTRTRVVAPNVAERRAVPTQAARPAPSQAARVIATLLVVGLGF